MRQYIYVSTAPNLSDESLDSILASCARNNAERGVTGLLLYNGRNFLQLLEGAETDLLWVMARISADNRHSGISKLEDSFVTDRACPDWAMRHIKLVENVDQRRQALEAELPAGLSDTMRRIILNFAALN